MSKLNDYLDSLRSENTKEIYKQGIDKFFKQIKNTPDEYLSSIDNKKLEEDMKKFVKYIIKFAPYTQRAYISGLKGFFEYHDIEFSNKFLKKEIKSKLKPAHSLTLDDKPSINQMKTILSYGDLKTKALFVTLASSGMRVSELLQITPDHIDFTSTPTMITLESWMTKNKRPRRVFVSIESTNLLKEWLNGGRERYLNEIEHNMKGIHTVNRDDKRVFPMCTSSIRLLWSRLLKKSGLNKKCLETDRYELHPHSLRKFFLSNLKTEIPEVIVEALAGHSKYLDEAYSRYSLDELKNYYLKGQSKLLIFENAPDLTGIHEEMKEKDQQIKELLERLKIQELKTQGLENALDIEKMKNGKK